MYFTGQNLPLPHRPFPFDLSAQGLPACVPDCHLVRTVIPCLPREDSLGVFHHKTFRLLASFARMVSRSNNTGCMAITSQCLSSFPTCSLKAGYTARSTRFCAPPCRFIHSSCAKQLPNTGVLNFVTQYWVSAENGSYAPCHWSAPEILNPQHPP